MRDKKRAFNFSESLEANSSNDKEFEELLTIAQKCKSEMTIEPSDELKEKILAQIKEGEINMQPLSNKKRSRFILRTAMASTIAIVLIVGTMFFGQPRNGKVDVIKEVLAATSQPGEALHLIGKYTFDYQGKTVSTTSNYWIDLVNNKGTIMHETMGGGGDVAVGDYIIDDHTVLSRMDNNFTYYYLGKNQHSLKNSYDPALANYRNILSRKNAQVLGKDTYRGKEVYKVKVIERFKPLFPNDINSLELIYSFDSDTFLPVFVEMTDKSPIKSTKSTLEITAEKVSINDENQKYFELPNIPEKAKIIHLYEDLSLASKLKNKNFYYLGDNFVQNGENFTLKNISQEHIAKSPEATEVINFTYANKDRVDFVQELTVRQVALSQRNLIDYLDPSRGTKDKDLINKLNNHKQIEVAGYKIDWYSEKYGQGGKTVELINAQFVKGDKYISIDGIYSENELQKIIESLRTY